MEENSFYEQFFENIIKLKDNIDDDKYKYAIISLIFLKYINEKPNTILQEFTNGNNDSDEDNNFNIPDTSKWNYIISKSNQKNIHSVIDVAFKKIAKENTSIKDTIPNNYFSNLSITSSNLNLILAEINKLDFNQNSIRDSLDYFLNKYASYEGKEAEHHTPVSVVKLLVNLVEPYKGIIYDPCCGYGNTFIESLKFTNEKNADKEKVFVFGQEKNHMARKTAKINLAIRGINYDLGERHAGVFHKDLHKDLKADYILADPPFNQKNWRKNNELVNDYRWDSYITPPTSRANYAWLLHIVSKLSNNGVAGVIIASGSLNSRGLEYIIRRGLVEDDLVEVIVTLPTNLFYTTDNSASLWILNKNKSKQFIKRGNDEFFYRDRFDEVLFLDLRQWGSFFDKSHRKFSDDDIKKVASIVKNWRIGEQYEDIPQLSYSATKREIILNDYSLFTGDYLDFFNKEDIHFDEDINDLKQELVNLFAKEEESSNQIMKIIEEIEDGFKL